MVMSVPPANTGDLTLSPSRLLPPPEQLQVLAGREQGVGENSGDGVRGESGRVPGERGAVLVLGHLHGLGDPVDPPLGRVPANRRRPDPRLLHHQLARRRHAPDFRRRRHPAAHHPQRHLAVRGHARRRGGRPRGPHRLEARLRGESAAGRDALASDGPTDARGPPSPARRTCSGPRRSRPTSPSRWGRACTWPPPWRSSPRSRASGSSPPPCGAAC